MTKHTPGPLEASARLHAAAPETAAERDRLKESNFELVVALKLVLDVMSGWPERVAVAQAAIRKAEGGTR